VSAESDSRQHEIETRNASACPVVRAIDQVGTPWRMNVVYALEEGERRFNELKRATGARSKTLSDALEELVERGVVARRMEEDAPVAVYYDLTTKGEELLGALDDLNEWARDWGEGFPEEEPHRFPSPRSTLEYSKRYPCPRSFELVTVTAPGVPNFDANPRGQWNDGGI